MQQPILHFLLLITLTVSGVAYCMVCPRNFNTIEVGDSIDRVTELCGTPDERTEYKETIKQSSGMSGGQSYSSAIAGANSAYAQSAGNYQGLQSEKEKVLIITKFFYKFPQPSILIFVDGILREKQLVH